MMDHGATDRVRRFAAEQYIHPARKLRQNTIQIHSGKLEKSAVQHGLLGRNRLPVVCGALRSKKFLTENGLELLDVKAPPSGMSSTVIYTYRLASDVPAQPTGSTASKEGGLLSLRGVLKATYKKLGGAEKFHEQQREDWTR